MTGIAITTLARLMSTDEHPQTWHADAACADADPLVFFPEDVEARHRTSVADEARYICTTCPVRVDCLEDAMRREVPSRRRGVLTAAHRHGIRGGLDGVQREAEQRRRDGGAA